ncbi:rhomboid family intramembrane serine protease [Thalassotalea sp. 1_MG-2023]|uniref:rhomboid family intramembrane serine protease n=1 Tax=Thalassotalea sp. 1_MG-2023 TaxID=3062680 RepID=UPI0026E2DCF6|nr:rhomboid family intramembrane serine protease [Thalassotalea sp. 1_MG-2023]MDO6427506.1 rhomboid family intramembrane serine protease [Thalassotalea sp. 1_MG-2023]
MLVGQYGKRPKKLKNLEVFIKGWRPIEGWMIQDENKEFVLPTHHSILGKKFYKAYKYSTQRSFVFLLISMLLICAALIFRPTTLIVQHISLFMMLLLVISIDMWLSIKSLNSCKQKVEFLFEIQKSFKGVFLLFIPFFCITLLLQFYFSDQLGSFEAFVMYYGNYYPEIDLSSFWRFLIGPLLHGDINHWLVNIVLTILFASMMPKVNKFFIFYVFYIGAVGSHIVTFFVHKLFNTPFDALLGASGGAYTLIAVTICQLFQKKHSNVALSLVALVIFIELSVSLLPNNVSHSAHLSGFSLGILLYTTKKALICRQV